MRLLLDTQLLVWAKAAPDRLPVRACELLREPVAAISFSVVSLWEIVIKAGLGRPDFPVEARRLRGLLLHDGAQELAVTAEHAFAVAALPALHRDPFDRLLLAQARVEGLTLLTTDRALAAYGAPVERVA